MYIPPHQVISSLELGHALYDPFHKTNEIAIVKFYLSVHYNDSLSEADLLNYPCVGEP
jgi:hypothetical protein